MRALDRKLLRDISSLKGQVAAIAIVIGAGVMTLIISLTTIDAIGLTKTRFYEDFRFAHVFADLKRAPDGVIERLREIPGVNHVETRVRSPVRLEVPGFDDPVRGHIISIPDGAQPNLNRLYVREGSLPASGRSDEIAISEPFAQAHGLRPGDHLSAVIRGRLERLTVSGVVLSPEYVYQIGPTDLMPDYERYGILWMNRRSLASAFAMDGAFNNVALVLRTGASEARAIEALDAILERYGGIGAYGRDEQMSHRFLSDELDQLRVMATVMPTIFLGVSAFLLHVLMGRIIRAQREQVAVLKAFGYGNSDLALHYGMLTGMIVMIGAVLGMVFGAWAADGLAQVYMEYFRFPEMSFRLRPRVILLGVAVAGGAAFLGTFAAVRSAVKLPPAEAMRPPPPERFRRGWLERTVLGKWLGQPTRMVFRNLSRHPLKSSLSVLGIGLSGALILVGSYQFNAVDHMIDVQYRLVQRMDVNLTFTEPTPERAGGELLHQPGVRHVETYRSVPVRFVKGVLDYRTSILGLESGSQLRGLIDERGHSVPPPSEGVLMTDHLAEYLGVVPGDSLQVEVLEGHRRTLQVPLAGTVDEPIGVGAYMDRRALNRLMREGPAISGAWLLSDRNLEGALFERLRGMPRVDGIGLIAESERGIREHITDTVLVFMGVLLLLAGSIAFAVVYNNARIAFAERSRELATLRVLGFTRGEVGWIFMGEIALLTLLAIPVGWMIGTVFAFLLSEAMSVDMFRIPFLITPRTYAFSAAGVLAASVLSVLLMVRRLRRLDMVSALKTIE